MKKGWTLTQETFDLLLNWLSPDKDQAGVAYENVRHGLIKLFTIRGCRNPEVLADETINRVISKLPTLINEYKGNQIYYFYSIANKVWLESRSPHQRREEQLDSLSHSKFLAVLPSSDDTNVQLDHLKDCLQTLSVENRELIIQYFAVEKSAKFEHRRLISEARGLNLNSLRIRVVRLKKQLRDCVINRMSVHT